MFRLFADVTGDGRMEAVSGNTTYTIPDIRDRLNNPGRMCNILAISRRGDGKTSVADIEGKGVLNVITTTEKSMNGATPFSEVYVWDGKNGRLIASYKTNGGIGSTALVGDINADGKVEICISAKNGYSGTGNNIFALRYDGTDMLKTVWTPLVYFDNSGHTGLTMFDFDLDGAAELVYRDEKAIMIIDGKTGKLKKKPDGTDAKFPCFHGTGNEYPIIVDADGDGFAEIYVTGGTTYPYLGKERVMKFDGSTSTTNAAGVITVVKDNNWAPARNVWHQYGFNPIMINEDLTIPQNPINRAAAVWQRDGTSFQAFNNYMQQTGPVDEYIKPFVLGPDLTFNFSSPQQLIFDGISTTTINTTIVNQGDVDYVGDIKIDFYYHNAGIYTKAGGDIITGQTIASKGSHPYSISFPFDPNTAPAGSEWYLIINAKDNVAGAAPEYYYSSKECKDWNNLTSRLAFVSGDRILCENDRVNLDLSPANTYDCYWYLDAAGTIPYIDISGNNKGDSKEVLKSANYTDTYYIKVVVKGDATLTPISRVFDKVILYLSPDELVWTGAFDNDWHNRANWSMPGDPLRTKEYSYIPRKCTAVLIPRGLDNYPDLTPGKTNYDAKYDKAECSSIEYEHEYDPVANSRHVAGELARPDMLDYDKVIANLDLAVNRYYAISFPLQEMYTGDLYNTDPNPFDDKLFVWTQNWRTDIQSGIGGWHNYFFHPTVKPATSYGLGVWLDNDRDLSVTNVNMRFPRTDIGYFLYDEVTEQPESWHAVSRTAAAHQYIFEPDIVSPLTMAVSIAFAKPNNAGDRGTFLFGNPFISHLDFEELYAANSGVLEPYYKIVNGMLGTAIDTYYSLGGVTSGNPLLTQYIAPWQSVVLTFKPGTSSPQTLTIPFKASVNNIDVAAMLRSSKGKNYMTIAIADGNDRKNTSSRALISFKDGLNLEFDNSFDVKKTFFVEYFQNDPTPSIEHSASSVFVISKDGYYLDRKGLGDVDQFEFPIGIKSNHKGAMIFAFENMEDFFPEYATIYFLDKQTNRKVELYRNNKWPTIYRFENDAPEYEVSNRFALIGLKNGTSIEEENYEKVELYVRFFNGKLSVQAPNEELIQEISIYDLSGKLVKLAKNVNENTFETILGNEKAVYILSAKTDKQVYNQKIINQTY